MSGLLNKALIDGEAVHVLADLAHRSNRLAKTLPRQYQTAAYGIKDCVAELLLLLNAATVNGVSAEGTLGLTVSDSSQFHVPIRKLRHDARAIADQQLPCVPVMGRLGDRLRSNPFA